MLFIVYQCGTRMVVIVPSFIRILPFATDWSRDETSHVSADVDVGRGCGEPVKEGLVVVLAETGDLQLIISDIFARFGMIEGW